MNYSRNTEGATANYNLPIWGESDLTDWSGQLNPAFNKIDAELKNNADGVSVNGTLITGLAERNTAAESRLTELETEDTDIKSDITDLSGRMEVNTTHLRDVDTAANLAKQGVTSINERLVKPIRSSENGQNVIPAVCEVGQAGFHLINEYKGNGRVLIWTNMVLYDYTITDNTLTGYKVRPVPYALIDCPASGTTEMYLDCRTGLLRIKQNSSDVILSMSFNRYSDDATLTIKTLSCNAGQPRHLYGFVIK